MMTFLRWFFMVGVTTTLLLIFLDTSEGKTMLARAGQSLEPYVGKEAVAWTKDTTPPPPVLTQAAPKPGPDPAPAPYLISSPGQPAVAYRAPPRAPLVTMSSG